MNKLKILLTGATGFIGTNFILKLHKKYEITALVRKNSNITRIKKKKRGGGDCKICFYDGDLNTLIKLLVKINSMALFISLA